MLIDKHYRGAKASKHDMTMYRFIMILKMLETQGYTIPSVSGKKMLGNV